jgi:hypothetical protein
MVHYSPVVLRSWWSSCYLYFQADHCVEVLMLGAYWGGLVTWVQVRICVLLPSMYWAKSMFTSSFYQGGGSKCLSAVNLIIPSMLLWSFWHLSTMFCCFNLKCSYYSSYEDPFGNLIPTGCFFGFFFLILKDCEFQLIEVMHWCFQLVGSSIRIRYQLPSSYTNIYMCTERCIWNICHVIYMCVCVYVCVKERETLWMLVNQIPN